MNWKRIGKVMANKYVVATAVFLLVIAFMDDYSLQVSSRLSRELKQLKAEEQEMKEAMVADSIAAAALKDNLAAKERYGRENYYMKRADEDVFVIK